MYNPNATGGAQVRFLFLASRASVTATHKTKDNISLPCVKNDSPDRGNVRRTKG